MSSAVQPALLGTRDAPVLEMVLLLSVAILGCRKLGENGPCRLMVVELGQNHLTVDRDVPVDRPHVCVHLE